MQAKAKPATAIAIATILFTVALAVPLSQGRSVVGNERVSALGETVDIRHPSVQALDPSTGIIYDCSDFGNITEIWWDACNGGVPPSLEHDHGPVGDQDPGAITPQHYNDIDWCSEETYSDGTVDKVCGEWHVEDNDGQHEIDLGGEKKVKYLLIWYCSSTGDCSDHASNGVIHNYPSFYGPTTAWWYQTFDYGVKICDESGGSGDTTSGTHGDMVEDSSAGCLTGPADHFWGAGLRYWP